MNSMQGKQVVITGPTSGIGKEIALGLAALGAELVLGCRDVVQGQQTADQISRRTRARNIAVMHIDTSSQQSIRDFARHYRDRYARLDVLVNNAGLNRSKRQMSVDDVELTFATNVLGYYLLTQELLNLIKASALARIVNVASTFASDLDLDDLQFEHRSYEGRTAYEQSKACDRMLTWALARRLKNSDATANVCFIPGLYHDLLNREPNQTELSAGLTYLAAHDRIQYGTTLLTSNEYRTDLIRAWYQTFLGRLASNGDINTGLSIFQTGGTDEQIIAIIVSSDEYFNLPRVGATNSGYVTALYQDVLGRSPSPSELTFWLGQLTGGATRLQVAQSILASTEYRTDLIHSWYRKFLGRAAANDEVTSWLAVFGTGGTDEQIVANLVGSEEYFARAGICLAYLPLIIG